jgi:hypothetical protein
MVLICLPGPIKKVVLLLQDELQNKQRTNIVSIRSLLQNCQLPSLCLPEQGDDVAEREEHGKDRDHSRRKGHG